MSGAIMIRVASDFSETPGGRFAKHGSFSGEEFRRRVLLPKLREAISAGTCVVVDLGGVAGYGASFLEEAFGGLVREGISKLQIERHLRINAGRPRFEPYRKLALEYIQQA